jgi:hypothetical protein
MTPFAVRPRLRRWQVCYLGVKTVCGAPPGVISVLLPLPLFMRKPCPPLPGSVVVSIDPTWPVTNTCPLGVMTECPIDDDGELKRATGVAEAESRSAPRAWAWTHDPATKAIATSAAGHRTLRQSSARVLLMSVSFSAFEPGPPHDRHFICSGTGFDGDLTWSPARHIALRRSTFDDGPVHGDMCEWNWPGAARSTVEVLRTSQSSSGHCQ